MAKEPKGLEKRVFSTVPTKALFNAKITALEWRVLGLIALHDGMTLYQHEVKGKPLGAGCVASNLTLAREARCSYAALVRAVKSLELKDLIVRHDRRGGKTEAAMRVRYDVPDNVPDGSEQYDEPVILNVTNPSFQYDENDHSDAPRRAENCDEQAPHYNSLRGELDSAEAEELNSTKWRDLEIAKTKSAEAGLGRESIRALMSPKFDTLESPAQVAQIQRGFSQLDHDPHRIIPTEREEMTSLLWVISDHYAELDFGQQAQRLLGEMDI